MKFRFVSTVVVQMVGEAEAQGDTFSVMTERKGTTIIPAIMFDNIKDMESMSVEDKELAMRIIQHNVLHKATLLSAIPNVTTGVPVAMPEDGVKH